MVARDEEWATATKDVTIKVTNVEEGGSVMLSHTHPEVETALMATLSDPDDGETGVKWQWHRLEDTTSDIGALTDDNVISGKTSARYVPVAADGTKFLAVKATYTDKVRNVNDDDVPTNNPEMIFRVSANAVRTKFSSNAKPYFENDGTATVPPTKVTAYTRYIRENREIGTGVSLSMADALTSPDTDTGVTVTGADVKATDTDGTGATPVDDDSLQYELSGASKDYFELDSAGLETSTQTVTIQTKKMLDHEDKDRHTVTVKATDPSGGSVTVRVTINVVNEPEAPKVTGPKRIEYMENGTAAVETYMGKDPDGSAAIQWTLSGDDGDATGELKVTKDSGGSTMLAFKKSPDYEMRMGGSAGDSNIYEVMLKATFVGTTPAECTPGDTETDCASQTIMVMVTDVEEAPEFSKSTATLSVKETTPMSDNAEATTGPNADIGTEMAKDGDVDKLTYSLGGRDAGSFNIIPANGMIIRKAPLDYETKNMYQVTVTATDPSGLKDTIAITIEVLNVPEAPTIGAGGLTITATSAAPANYAENGTDDVAAYEAEGPNAARASWSLEGGDSGDFRLTGSGMSRMLKFSPAPNYEMPMDAGTDNTYMVTVKASHGSGDAMVMDSQDVTVTVTNVEEMGKVTFWKGTADVTTAVIVAGEMITAAVMDPDGNQGDTLPIAMDYPTITGATWQWARHADAGSMPAKDSSGWTDISGATSADYTPDATADDGMYLRATASYDDGEGTGKMATVVSYSGVTTNRAPMFPAATATREVAENTAAGMNIGAPVTATDADDEMQTYTLTGADAASFDIGSATGQLMTKAALDYETKMTYMVTVTATDPDGETASIDVTINVANVGLDNRYDANDDGNMEIGEVRQSISDYFAVGSTLTVEQVKEVITLYFES